MSDCTSSGVCFFRYVWCIYAQTCSHILAENSLHVCKFFHRIVYTHEISHSPKYYKLLRIILSSFSVYNTFFFASSLHRRAHRHRVFHIPILMIFTQVYVWKIYMRVVYTCVFFFVYIMKHVEKFLCIYWYDMCVTTTKEHV